MKMILQVIKYTIDFRSRGLGPIPKGKLIKEFDEHCSYRKALVFASKLNKNAPINISYFIKSK